MTLKLRGHHLLCVHGFQGMGYDEDFIASMAHIVDRFRNIEDDFNIQVKIDLDTVCDACPHHGEEQCEKDKESDQHVKMMDFRVIRYLQLDENRWYRKSELIKRTQDLVVPNDLDHLCAGCSWLSYGVCKKGIEKLKDQR